MSCTKPLKVICGKARAAKGPKRATIARTALKAIEQDSLLTDVLDLHALLHPTDNIFWLRKFATDEMKLKDAFGAPFRELAPAFAARVHDVLTVNFCTNQEAVRKGIESVNLQGLVYERDGIPFDISDQLDEVLDKSVRRCSIEMKRARLCAIYGGALKVSDRVALEDPARCSWLSCEAAEVAAIFGLEGEVELGESIKVYTHELLAGMAKRHFWSQEVENSTRHDFIAALFEGACRHTLDRARLCAYLCGEDVTLGLESPEAAADYIVQHADHVFRYQCVLDESHAAYAAKSGQ
jgi:hypothetical protein